MPLPMVIALSGVKMPTKRVVAAADVERLRLESVSIAVMEPPATFAVAVGE